MDDRELEAMANEAEEEVEEVEFIRRRRTMEDFRFDESQDAYWDITIGELRSARAVDGAIPREFWPTRPDGRNGQLRQFKPSVAINDIDTGLTVEGSTWWPGEGQFLHNVVVTARGAVEQKGAVTLNTYVPPRHDLLKSNQNPDKWIEHVKFLFPDPVEHEHFFDFAAHMIQRPDEKINHGIVIAGKQGIGKDTAMAPLRKGIGEWNAAEVEPDAVTSQYNPHVKAVMLVINEVRPHDEDHKASNFYNQIKPLLAAPPDMLPMHVKYANPVYIRNLCHVFLTTNDPLTMYIPAEDRRLFVMTSPLPDPKVTPIFGPDYFEDMWAYLNDGGSDAAVRWLLNRDISQITPGNPPPMTMGKKMIMESAHEVRRSLVDEIFEDYSDSQFPAKSPDVIFTADLLQFIKEGPHFDDRQQMLKAIRAKNFHFKMNERGYELVKNPYSTEWKRGKFRSRAAFVRSDVPREERERAVEKALESRPLQFEFND